MSSRAGNFSSSQIYRLMNAGKRKMTQAELDARPKKGKGSSATLVEDFSILDSTALTYIKEKVREAKLKRSITVDVNTRPMIWGKVMEMYVFREKLDKKYRDMNHAGRLQHPETNSNGIPDFLYGEVGKDSVVCEMKAPTSFVKFCDYADNTETLEKFKENHKDHYWQIIHNASLTFSDYGEFIWYIPYIKDLPDIMNFVQELDEKSLPSDLSLFKIKWIADEIFDFIEAGREPSIPYLPNDSEYKDLNFFKFKVAQSEKELLTQRVKMAAKELTNNTK